MLPSISNNSESLQEEKEHSVEGLWDMPIIEELAAFFFNEASIRRDHI